MKTAMVLTFLLWAVTTLAGPLHQLHTRNHNPLQPVDSGDGISSANKRPSSIFAGCMIKCRQRVGGPRQSPRYHVENWLLMARSSHQFKPQTGFTRSSWTAHCAEICATTMDRDPNRKLQSARRPRQSRAFGLVNPFRNMGRDMIGEPWLRYFKNPALDDQTRVNGHRLQPGQFGKPGLVPM